MRGLTARFTPGYKWLDSATVGSHDLGKFDPFTIGKIRYIDRDNAKVILFQGPLFGYRPISYDLIRISLPRLWAGPNFNTGSYTGQDGAYGLQLRFSPSSFFDGSVIYERVRDLEIDNLDGDFDDGRDVASRFSNDVTGIRFGIHPGPVFDFRGQAYFSKADSDPRFGVPTGFGLVGLLAGARRRASTTRPSRPTSMSTIRSASACRSTWSTSTSAPSTPPSSPPAARPTCCSPRATTPPGSSPARTTRRSACSPATPPASATAAGRATPSRWRRSTSTTSSRTSRSPWPRR